MAIQALETNSEPLSSMKEMHADRRNHIFDLLTRTTGVHWMMNGTLLEIEKSDDFQAARPGLLEKLHRMVEMGVIDLTDQPDGGVVITALDVRALEAFAAQDWIDGLEETTTLDFALDGDEEDGDQPLSRRTLRCKAVNPSQLSRLYRLMIKNDMNMKLLDQGEALQEMQATVEMRWDREGRALEKDREQEAQRRNEGPDVAAALSELTHAYWIWDGLEVVLGQPVDTLDPAFFERMKSLEGAVSYHYMRLGQRPDGTAAYANYHILDADMETLRRVTASCAAIPMLNTLFAPLTQPKSGSDTSPLPGPAWHIAHGVLISELPGACLEWLDRDFQFTTVLKSLQQKGAIDFAYTDDRTQVMITQLDLPKLQEALEAMAELPPIPATSCAHASVMGQTAPTPRIAPVLPLPTHK